MSLEHTCKNCGAKIPRTLDFCSDTCKEKYKSKKSGEKEISEDKDLNVELIKKAIETKTEIILIPRRSHTIKGIPIRYDKDTYRIYVDTGRNIKSVLLKEIGHFSFPKELYKIQK